MAYFPICQLIVEAPIANGSDTGKCNDCNGLQHPELTRLGSFSPYQRYLALPVECASARPDPVRGGSGRPKLTWASIM